MDNVQKLGKMLSGRMKKTAVANKTVTLELGIIGSDKSLIPNSIESGVPKGAYSIDASLKDTLKPGDHVVIGWAGSEPVILANLDRVGTCKHESECKCKTCTYS